MNMSAIEKIHMRCISKCDAGIYLGKSHKATANNFEKHQTASPYHAGETNQLILSNDNVIGPYRPRCLVNTTAAATLDQSRIPRDSPHGSSVCTSWLVDENTMSKHLDSLDQGHLRSVSTSAPPKVGV